VAWKAGAEIDGDNLGPLVGGKFLDRGDELDTGIVDQQIDTANALPASATMAAISSPLLHVGAAVEAP